MSPPAVRLPVADLKKKDLMNSFRHLLVSVTLAAAMLAFGGQRVFAAGGQKAKKPKQEKPVSYNRLLKSMDYDLKYKRALEYYYATKKGSDKNSAGNYQKAGTLLEQLAPVYVGTPREDSVAYYTAASLYKGGYFDASSTACDIFRKRFPSSVFIEHVEYMYALGFYYLSPDPQRDQATSMQAIIAINEYLERYPASDKRASLLEKKQELMNKLHDKTFENAKLYYTIGKYKSAVVALQNALDKYPASAHRKEAMYLMLKSQYLLSRNSYVSLQKDRYLTLMDYYYNFVSEFPDSEYSKELKKIYDEAKSFIARQDIPQQEQDIIKNENILFNGTEKK